MASMTMGKQAMIAKAKMPNKIRSKLVVDFIVRLHIVRRCDEYPSKKVPLLFQNSTQ
jgi:hypothetical protein